jgi:hypothetical protein
VPPHVAAGLTPAARTAAASADPAEVDLPAAGWMPRKARSREPSTPLPAVDWLPAALPGAAPAALTDSARPRLCESAGGGDTPRPAAAPSAAAAASAAAGAAPRPAALFLSEAPAAAADACTCCDPSSAPAVWPAQPAVAAGTWLLSGTPFIGAPCSLAPDAAAGGAVARLVPGALEASDAAAAAAGWGAPAASASAAGWGAVDTSGCSADAPAGEAGRLALVLGRGCGEMKCNRQ